MCLDGGEKKHLLGRYSVLMFSLKICLDVGLEISYICALNWVCRASVYSDFCGWYQKFDLYKSLCAKLIPLIYRSVCMFAI